MNPDDAMIPFADMPERTRALYRAAWARLWEPLEAAIVEEITRDMTQALAQVVEQRNQKGTSGVPGIL